MVSSSKANLLTRYYWNLISKPLKPTHLQTLKAPQLAACKECPTGSSITSPVHATNSNSAKQSPEVNKSPCRAFRQAVGGSPPTVKRNCNIERCQHRRE